mgnify:CR=1 FL=1
MFQRFFDGFKGFSRVSKDFQGFPRVFQGGFEFKGFSNVFPGFQGFSNVFSRVSRARVSRVFRVPRVFLRCQLREMTVYPPCEECVPPRVGSLTLGTGRPRQASRRLGDDLESILV